MALLEIPDAIRQGLDEAVAGVGIWDRDCRLIYANRLFRTLFQLDRSSIVDLTYRRFLDRLVQSHELILANQADEWVQDQLAAFAGETCFEQPMADGRTLEINHRPTEGGGMTTAVSDVSNVRRIESALRKSKADAETSDQAKSRFLRAANHDLRQPLATLKILIYSCIEEDDLKHRRDLLHAMDISVSIMEDLLGALLQIGQLDAGRITARITTFQLDSLVDRLRIQFAHVAREKGLDLRIVATRFAVLSDKALLERILSNIVANAIRYTDVGSVLVVCRPKGTNVVIEVRDSGRGIEAEHLTHIFDEFYQVPNARRTKRPGLGLGLNIVKRIADILGHSIRVRSEPGRGSIFSVSIPAGDVWQSELAEPEISEAKGGEFAGLPVLLVEDDPVLQRATLELLERWGMRVLACASVAEALASLDVASPPRLIIADYSLGRELGSDAVNRIRTAAGCAIPAFIMTAEVDPTVIAKIKADGLAVLIKPVSPPRLRVMMHNLIFELPATSPIPTESRR